ncbi:hypothetical protein MSG28_015073 [Choristoneura fumiferana]|uniref:Uncharacterized protein n=1 Tax=Choristoneura fumiferana TaxID=7141 RepID=A0ACC0KZE7_CHOFU|nr:hypothetical protein MSG28_015073 [Choristoneura fumiferana]
MAVCFTFFLLFLSYGIVSGQILCEDGFCRDEFDARHELGQIGALEQRPTCDAKGQFMQFHCVPTQTCFCQSEEGERLFGEVLHMGASMKERIEFLVESERDGWNVDFFSEIPECLPDGTYGRVVRRSGSKICVDERGQPIQGYEAMPGTEEFNTMNCNCALTSLLMDSMNEKPVCCKNGNFRNIQCRRGACRCVDSDGRQRKKTTTEVLEKLETNIKRIEQDGQSKEQKHKRVIGYVMAYSVGLYVLFAILYYFKYVGRSQYWLYSVLHASPLLLLPVLRTSSRGRCSTKTGPRSTKWSTICLRTGPATAWPSSAPSARHITAWRWWRSSSSYRTHARIAAAITRRASSAPPRPCSPAPSPTPQGDWAAAMTLP